MTDRNKIALELTNEQLSDFIGQLAELPGKDRTLKQIQHKAAELGITISLMSAKAFRDTTFQRELDRVRVAQEIAGRVEALDKGGNTMADASAKLLSKRIFNQLLEAEDPDSGGEVNLDEMTLAVSRLRRGNVQQTALEAKLRQLELAQFNAAEIVLKQTRQLKAIADDRSIDEGEKIERIRKRLFGEAPTAAAPAPAAPVAESK